MPTLNHDSSAVPANPINEVSKKRNRRIVGASLGATLITLAVLFAAMALAPVDASAANTCTLTTTQATTTWGVPSNWTGCGGTYPGQGAGDTAIINSVSGFTLKVDAFLNPVTLQIGGAASSIPIQVASGGTLTLETSSTATSSNTFTIDSGGTMGTNSGANIAGFQGNIHVNGGTFNSAGTIQITSGTFTYSGGSLTGSGTIGITNSAIFDGAVGTMPISGTTFNDSGFLSYTSATNAITLSSGASINVNGAGQFSVATDAAINGTAAETISIASGTSMQKTSGTGFNVISPFIKNDGTVTVAGAGVGGGFGLSGNGTHSGTFTTGSSSQTIAFGGNNAFNAGTSFGGATPIKFVAGTQTFNASISATTGLKWAGGTIAGSGPFNISGTSTLDGTSPTILTGVINNTGAMTYTPTGGNLLSINGATAKLDTTGGSFTIAGDYDIQAVPSGAGTLRVSGGTGQITKSAGASGSSILASVDNSSSTVTNNATGALNFAGGGKSTGNMSVPANTNVMNFTNGTFDDNGVFSGLGTINVAGGTLNINAATSFGSGSPSLNLNGGTLGGTGTVTILGASNWSSGTITGSNPFNVSSTGVMAITGALGPMSLDGRVFNDNSSVVYNSPTNNLTLKNSASIFNGGTFTAIGSGTIDTDGSAVSITNNGQFNKTNSSLFIVKPTFNNNGTGVSITGGVLALDGDGVSSAPFNMSAGTEVWFPTPFGTTYTWTAGTTFSGGKVTIDGTGNVATTGLMTINNTNLELRGGSFTTPANFTVTSPATFKWKAGTLAGAGHTIISSGTTFDMTTESAARSMSGHTIDNAGNATLVASTQPPSIDSSSTFNNSGNLDIQSDGSFNTNASGVNAFNNSGNVKKSAGAAAFIFQIPYNQTAGATDANSGSGSNSIVFNAGGSMSGGVLKATTAGDTVSFNGGTFNVSGGSFNSGAPGKIALAGTATLNVNAPIATTSFIQGGGTLQGSSNLTISSGGNYDWSGGTMAGSGQLVVASGGTLSVSGTSSTPLVLNSHTISNSGTISYAPLSGGQINQVTLQGTASIANQSGGLLNVTDNSSIIATGGSTTIVNSGNILTAGSSSMFPAITNNPTGLIKPSGGSLTFLSGTSNGTLDAVSPGALNFGSTSTFTITGGTWGNSGGGFWVTGGDVTINAPFSLSNLTLNSGQIDGTGTLTLTGANAWGGGTMAGSGTTTNSGTLTMSNNGGSLLDTRTFNNTGTVNYQNLGNSLQLKNGAVFNNSNVFDFQGDANFTCNCAIPGLFHNLGTGILKKTSGTGTSIFTAPLANDGSVQVNAGTMQFTAAGTHNGSFTPASGASIEFDAANTFNAPSSLTGAGNIGFAFGNSTINSGTVTPGVFTVNGANVTLNSAATIGALNLHNAATLGGSGPIALTAASPASDWTGGTINGSGTLTVNAGANFQLDGLTASMTLDSRPLVNNGTLSYSSTANGLILANSAVITNAGGATLNLNAGPGIGVSGINNVIANNGLLQRTATGTIGISPAVTNTGTINANLGTLAFNGGLTQTIGSTNLLGGSISSPSTIALSGGTLTGNGTVSAAVNNTNGIVAPGNPSAAGTLTITGAYAQGVNGGMSLKIGGTSNYDIVDASASGVTLGGTLNVSLFNAFVPASGNPFDVLRFSTRSGDFATYNLPSFAGGGTFQKSFVSGTPNVLRLTAVVTASDLQIMQSAPASLLHNQTGTWTLTITNGPTPVTNVVVTDTFANANYVTATSVGPCTPSGSTVTCTLGSLAANQSVNVSLQLSAPNLVTISNSASVTATEFDPNPSNNNTGNAFTTVFPAANLSITNTASGNPVNAGSPLSFAIGVSNAGPDATSGTVTVTNTFPSGVTSFTFSGAGWNCGSLAGSTATCTNVASIANAGSAPTLTLSITAPASGPAVDSATVSASTADPNNGNNTASQSVTVVAQADVIITKTGPVSVVAGQNIVYTVTVTNNGPSPASGVNVADTTPAGLTFVSNSGGCATAYPCALGTLTNGQTVTITSTYSTTPSSAGTVSNTATVSATTTDPTPSNNGSTKTTSITASADLAITKSGPASSAAGSPLVYTITVTNNGPSDATAVSVADPTPAGATFVSNSGACTTSFPCALGTITAGQSKTITSTFSTPANFTGTSIANTATVSSATTPDPNAANNSATATTAFGSASADLGVTKSGPSSATNGSTAAYTITVTNNGPASATNVVLNDPTPAGLAFTSATSPCITGFPCSLGTLTAGQSVTITASYSVTATSGSVTNTALVSGTSFDPISANDNSSATTTIGPSTCGAQPPSLIAPANGATITSPVTFSWSAAGGATSYRVFASIGGASTQEIGSTGNTTITLPVAGGNVSWFVQALGIDNCSQLVSATRTFTVCPGGIAPEISVVGTSSSGQSYTVQWTDIAGVATYELQESATDTFDNPTSFQVSGTSRPFTKSAAAPTAFFYRVRALSACGQGPGPFSTAQRVVVVPVAPPINGQSPSATVDINNKHVVVQTVFIPGQGTALAFTATTDEPWLTVTPASGILPAAGLTLSVSANPADLPNGTFTATIIVTFPGSPAKTGALGDKPPVTVPVSISVVTPVSPTTISTPSANSLIIPSVGHLDGINSQWRSDVRITNTAAQKINYLLRFTPAGGDPNAVKQTQISIAANDTMALDDIVKNWYGVGALGDAANGVLEVRPLNTSGKGTPNAEDVNVSFATVASSRTFNQSAGGTLGQYIPAIPFANFIGKVSGDARAGILSLQQIAQSPAYRTNLGIVEAAGKSASVLVSVFDAAGKNLLNFPIDLKAGEQQQLNSFLAAKNITLADGRVEVKVTGGDGKVTAYASVVDNKTTDPLLVSGVPLVQTPARTFVMPGVADISNGLANWRTDLRIFNAGADPQYLTMTLYPLNDANGATISRSLTVNPGEVTILDNVLASRFGATNIGGAMHVDTLTDANLVVTGRTYNQVDGGGTYGQFIAAVTPADATGKGGHTLHVLQVEDSARYRTNLGIAEVSGKPVTVEVSVFLPDAKVAPKVTIPLAANEYRQFRVLQQLGVGTAYNARIAIKVIDGDGRITAYGSVIDMQTQDPTYVPAQ